MLRPRVIPALTMEHLAMVKTVRFRKPTYLGDPVNAVRILNSKEVDELIVLDITASRDGRSPDARELEQLASECFMPVCFGGGVRTVADAEAVLRAGFEKVSVNSAALADPSLVGALAEQFGSQAVVVSIDVESGRRGHRVRGADRGLTPVDWTREMVDRGAGEVLLTAVDRDGTGNGYDLELVAEVSAAVDVPVLALGGAGTLAHLGEAIGAGASGVAAGRMFFTRGERMAALVSYPSPAEIEALPSEAPGAG